MEAKDLTVLFKLLTCYAIAVMDEDGKTPRKAKTLLNKGLRILQQELKKIKE